MGAAVYEFVTSNLIGTIFCIGVVGGTIYFIGKGRTKHEALDDMAKQAPDFLLWIENLLKK